MPKTKPKTKQPAIVDPRKLTLAPAEWRTYAAAIHRDESPEARRLSTAILQAVKQPQDTIRRKTLPDGQLQLTWPLDKWIRCQTFILNGIIKHPKPVGPETGRSALVTKVRQQLEDQNRSLNP